MADSPEQGQTYLIAGLGNPGREYRENRHNVGFMAVDRLAARLGVTFSRLESRALVTKASFQDQRLVLAKPQTYMNDSGAAISSLARFYKLPLENTLVVYDEVDLPFGVLRIRPAGGSAGHRGVRSVIERFGGEAFPRLRVGVGRPPGRMEAAAYVLQNFGRDDAAELPAILDRVADAILVYVSQGLATAMNQYNGPSVTE